MDKRVFTRSIEQKQQLEVVGNMSDEEALKQANESKAWTVQQEYPQPAQQISFERAQATPGFTPAEEPAAAPVEVAAEEAPKQEDSQALSQEAASEPIEVDHVAEAIAEAEAERAAEAELIAHDAAEAASADALDQE